MVPLAVPSWHHESMYVRRQILRNQALGFAMLDVVNKLKKGTVWVMYRIKASTTVKDEKRYHSKCCNKMPNTTREADIDRIQQLLDECDNEVLRGGLQEARLKLQMAGGSGGASGSKS